MTLITLPSGTVLANDYTLPIIVVSKVLMANDTNPHAKLYPYYLQSCMLMEFQFLS